MDTQFLKPLPPNLKPLPPKETYCTLCKSLFMSYLKMNAEYYKTCENCRKKIRIQGQNHRKNMKKFILELK